MKPTSMNLRKLSRTLGDDTGSGMVEFALCAMIFFTIMLGIADMCRAMYAWHYASYAAQQGARYAVVHGATWGTSCPTGTFTLTYSCTASSTDVKNYVKSLGMANTNNVTITPTWTATSPSCAGSCSACTTSNAQGCYVKVNVVYKFYFMTAFFKRATLSFTGTSQKVIQY